MKKLIVLSDITNDKLKFFCMEQKINHSQAIEMMIASFLTIYQKSKEMSAQLSLNLADLMSKSKKK